MCHSFLGPGLGCVLRAVGRSFDLSSLMCRPGGSAEDPALLGQDGGPDSGVFVNLALGHPPTETCRLRTASGFGWGAGEAAFRGRGTMSLSCSGSSRARTGTGTGEVGGNAGAMLVSEDGRACRLAGVGASGMCGKGVVFGGPIVTSPRLLSPCATLSSAPCPPTHPGCASTCLGAFTHAESFT